jgi:CheY-like chemotaxis protein
MNSLSILVADDEKEIRFLLREWLTMAGHSVVLVGSGAEACAAIQRQSFDLAITDMLMPDGDGIDVITEFRKTNPGARVLAMSGGGRYIDGRDYLDLAKGLGAVAVVLKPFRWADLRQAIEEATAAPPVVKT